MNKKVGERIKVIGRTMYTEIDLECEILGELPGGRYDQNLVMNYQYLDEAIRAYNKGKTKQQQHPMTEKVLAVMFLRLPDTATFEKVAHQITTSPEYQSPPVKCETLSSGISSFLDGFRDLLFGMRWLLVPAILITMALVIANAISISVRERRIEMAVLKVLGFTPNQILIMVLAEALLIGCLSGLFSGWIAMFLINDLIGGVSLPIGFLSTFFVAQAAPWWGLSIGGTDGVGRQFVARLVGPLGQGFRGVFQDCIRTAGLLPSPLGGEGLGVRGCVSPHPRPLSPEGRGENESAEDCHESLSAAAVQVCRPAAHPRRGPRGTRHPSHQRLPDWTHVLAGGGPGATRAAGL